MTDPYLAHLAKVFRAVERLSVAIDDEAARGRGGSRVEVDFDDLNTVVGWFGDFYETMRREKR